MSRRDDETQRMIEAMGFVLVRQNRHRVFKHPNAGILVCAVSASDHHARQNILATARRLLRRVGIEA